MVYKTPTRRINSAQTSAVCEAKFPTNSHTGAREIFYSETSVVSKSNITDSEAFTGKIKTIESEANYGGGESGSINSKVFTGGSVVTDSEAKSSAGESVIIDSEAFTGESDNNDSEAYQKSDILDSKSHHNK